MTNPTAPSQPIAPGSPAPGFSLPAVHREGAVSLDSYRGKSPLLLAVFRGLWCPFCRRAIADLGVVSDKLHLLSGAIRIILCELD